MKNNYVHCQVASYIFRKKLQSYLLIISHNVTSTGEAHYRWYKLSVHVYCTSNVRKCQEENVIYNWIKSKIGKKVPQRGWNMDVQTINKSRKVVGATSREGFCWHRHPHYHYHIYVNVTQ